MRSPNWHRDEIILALDLYFTIESKEIDSKNPKIIGLSSLLNKLPLHDIRGDNLKFRNPNGVTLKLSNFRAIDPNYKGKGMDRFSKLDKEVFYEFWQNKQKLKSIANQIKHTVSYSNIINKLYRIQEQELVSVKEGSVVYKLHRYKERDSRITKKKKDNYFKKNGKLDCEVCGFNFNEVYGELGFGFIEAHHKIPLNRIQHEVETTLDDLALVCSNCHRMLHRGLDNLSVLSLRKMLKN